MFVGAGGGGGSTLPANQSKSASPPLSRPTTVAASATPPERRLADLNRLREGLIALTARVSVKRSSAAPAPVAGGAAAGAVCSRTVTSSRAEDAPPSPAGSPCSSSRRSAEVPESLVAGSG